MAQLLGKCPRCGGNIYLEGNTKKCLQCGQEIKGKGYTTAYYKLNFAAILKDTKAFGCLRTGKKWFIPLSSLNGLIKRGAAKVELTPLPSPIPQSSNHLPELPAFSNDWPPEVQIKWLEVWGARR